MGGKSRKGGQVSKKLIEQLKHGGLPKVISKKSGDEEKKSKAPTLFDDIEKEEGD